MSTPIKYVLTMSFSSQKNLCKFNDLGVLAKKFARTPTGRYLDTVIRDVGFRCGITPQCSQRGGASNAVLSKTIVFLEGCYCRLSARTEITICRNTEPDLEIVRIASKRASRQVFVAKSRRLGVVVTRRLCGLEIRGLDPCLATVGVSSVFRLNFAPRLSCVIGDY